MPIPTAPTDTDATPLGARLKAVVARGPTEAVRGNAPAGLSSRAAPRLDRRDRRRLARLLGRALSRKLIA